MKSLLDIEAAQTAARNEKITARAMAGASLAELAAEFGLAESKLQPMLDAALARKRSVAANTLAAAVNAAGARCVWAEPAEAFDAERAAEALRQAAARVGADRVVLCVAILPPHDEVVMRGVA